MLNNLYNSSAFDDASIPKGTTNSMENIDTSDESWKRSWEIIPQNIENETLTRSSNQFQTKDYPTYSHGVSDPTNDGFGQTHMLPIYCSIMGMIIVTLLVYVFYKLWKQRDSLTNAKLSDGVYSDNASLSRSKENSVVLIGNSTSVLYTARGKKPTALASFHSNSISGGNTYSTEAKESFSNTPEDVHERQPLIGSTCTHSTDLNGPLDNVPMNILGFICYQLSQHGWNDLIMELKINSLEAESRAKHSNDEQPHSLTPLAKLSLDFERKNKNTNTGSTSQSYKEKEVICVASVIDTLKENGSVLVSSFINGLRSAKRDDLARLLEQECSVSAQVPSLANGDKFAITGVIANGNCV